VIESASFEDIWSCFSEYFMYMCLYILFVVYMNSNKQF